MYNYTSFDLIKSVTSKVLRFQETDLIFLWFGKLFKEILVLGKKNYTVCAFNDTSKSSLFIFIANLLLNLHNVSISPCPTS